MSERKMNSEFCLRFRFPSLSLYHLSRRLDCWAFAPILHLFSISAILSILLA